MSSRRQRSIPLGGRYRQVSLYYPCTLPLLFTHCNSPEERLPVGLIVRACDLQLKCSDLIEWIDTSLTAWKWPTKQYAPFLVIHIHIRFILYPHIHLTGKTTFEETVKCQATYMKSFLSWPFLSPLSKQRTQRQKEEIVNDLLRRYETLLVSNAAVAPGEIKHAYIVIQKTCS